MSTRDRNLRNPPANLANDVLRHELVPSPTLDRHDHNHHGIRNHVPNDRVDPDPAVVYIRSSGGCDAGEEAKGGFTVLYV